MLPQLSATVATVTALKYTVIIFYSFSPKLDYEYPGLPNAENFCSGEDQECRVARDFCYQLFLFYGEESHFSIYQCVFGFSEHTHSASKTDAGHYLDLVYHFLQGDKIDDNKYMLHLQKDRATTVQFSDYVRFVQLSCYHALDPLMGVVT